MKTKSTILGPNGEPLESIEKNLLTEDIAEAQLTGMRSVWGHQSIASFLTPTRLGDVLARGAQGDSHDFLTLAEEMEERDLHYASVLGTRKRAVSGIAHEIDAADESPRAQEIAQAVRDMVAGVELPDLAEDALDALGKGFACVEIIWQTSASQWWPARFEWRDPRFFRFDIETGRRVLLITDDAPMGRALPAFKFITHLPRIKCGLPIRGGLARMAAVAYLCKSVALTDWMAFIELFGMPARLGKYGPNATPSEKATLRNAVANIGSDAAAIIPESMQIELLERKAAAGGEVAYKVLCEWLDKQVSKGVIGQTMTADDGSSKAQAAVHNDVRDDIRNADLRQLAKTLNRDLIKPFVDFNYGPQEKYPCLKFPIAEPADIVALTAALKELVPLGLKVGMGGVRDKLGLPEPEEGEELLGAPSSTPLSPVGREAGGEGNKTAEDAAQVGLNRELTTALTSSTSSTQTELDQLIDEGAADWQPQLQPMIDPLYALAARSDTAEQFIAGLPALLDDMDDAELVKQLAVSFFKARGLGDVAD